MYLYLFMYRTLPTFDAVVLLISNFTRVNILFIYQHICRISFRSVYEYLLRGYISTPPMRCDGGNVKIGKLSDCECENRKHTVSVDR